jgi:ribonuclease R
MSEENKDPFVGMIRVTGKGVGYFPIPNSEEDFEIQPENMATALNRDTVRVENLNKETFGRKQAKVVEIIERHKTEFVGTLEKTPEGFFLTPDDKKMYMDIFVPASSAHNASTGDKAQVKLTEWPDPTKSPRGEVIRVIGRAGEHNSEMLGIVLRIRF